MNDKRWLSSRRKLVIAKWTVILTPRQIPRSGAKGENGNPEKNVNATIKIAGQSDRDYFGSLANIVIPTHFYFSIALGEEISRVRDSHMTRWKATHISIPFLTIALLFRAYFLFFTLIVLQMRFIPLFIITVAVVTTSYAADHCKCVNAEQKIDPVYNPIIFFQHPTVTGEMNGLIFLR